MSVLQSQENMNISSADHQVWNNAAFDDVDSQDLTSSRRSWVFLKFSNLANPEESLDSVLGKENQCPVLENQVSSISSTSLEPFKPVNRGDLMEKSRIEPIFKKGFVEKESAIDSRQNEIRDEKKIYEEIKEIEIKISRLSSRLESLRLQKSEAKVKTLANRGRIEFMEKNESFEKKIEEINSSLSARTNRRGLSLGPAEITAGGRRRTSMMPSEIFSAKKFGKQEKITPVPNRRKYCFLKLEHDSEEKSLSVCPKSRNVAIKTQILSRQAATTVSCVEPVKKEDGVTNRIHPNKLFKDGEDSALVTNKKPLRSGRVVASRFNQNANHIDDRKMCDEERSLSFGKSCVDAIDSKNLGTESRKKWEIPSDIVVQGNVEGEKTPQSIVLVPDFLPRIRIARLTNESPRDSGAAKRVAELIGRKSFFADDEEMDASVCQELSYAEEES